MSEPAGPDREAAGPDREPACRESGRARRDREPSFGLRPGVGGPALQPRVPRPWIERIGLAGIALVFASLFGALALGSWSGGELFLAVMGGIGCFMTLWVGALTLLRG